MFFLCDQLYGREGKIRKLFYGWSKFAYVAGEMGKSFIILILLVRENESGVNVGFWGGFFCVCSCDKEDWYEAHTWVL